MNSRPEEDLQQRLKQLELEINSFNPSHKQAGNQTNQPISPRWSIPMERVRTWFDGLSQVKKLAVLGVGLLLGGLLLQAVFKLITAAISLSVLALLVYIGYKFFVSRNFSNKQ